MTLDEARAIVIAEKERERRLRQAREMVQKADREAECARGHHCFLGERGWLSHCDWCGIKR